MPFQHSCFVSYRHTKKDRGNIYTSAIIDELEQELDLLIEREIYLDRDRLRTGQIFEDVLATKICQSVCMLVLYWPTYFSIENPFCSREFKAMEALEAQRLQLLSDPEEKSNGLILVLAVRGFKTIPNEILKRRFCKDIEPFFRSPVSGRDNGAFQTVMSEVSQYIADRCQAFERLNTDPFTGCPDFRLPDERDIRDWIQGIRYVGQPFTNR